MGSSAKKKKEKKRDFQKPKYKVGKSRPKASNHTDTSFRSKADPSQAIVMGHQSLSTNAPEADQQFRHNLSLASSSKSDKQRRNALAYLTGQLLSPLSSNPVGTHALLTKLAPLISDSSTLVRAQLLKLLHALPSEEVKDSLEHVLMYVRAGMTHLSTDISNDSLGVMEWLLDVTDDELTMCPGGWARTLSTFCAMMGWNVSSSTGGWTCGGIRVGLKAKDAQILARQMTALSRFLEAGFRTETTQGRDTSDYWLHLYRMPRATNAFGYLNLTGELRDEDGGMYLDREARQQIFHRRFLEAVSKGVERAKKEGGPAGRAAAVLDQAVQQGVADLEPSTAMDTQDLLELW